MLNLTYFGHSAFVATSADTAIAVDPFFSGNPKNTTGSVAQTIVNYVLVTHAHGDHLGDAIALAKQHKATIITAYDLGCYLQSKGCTVETMHIGGSVAFPFGRVKLTPAFHGNSVVEDGKVVSFGMPCGFLFTLGGKTVYHAGDTSLFSEMALLGEMHTIDVALLPIGDRYTMGITDAVKAAEMLRPKLTIPMHYNTFDALKADPQDFRRRLADKGLACEILEPSKTLTL